jgi:resuscitation-promoting factor RpfB
MKSKAKLGLALTAVLFFLWAYTHEPTPSQMLQDVPIMTARTKATMEEKRENKALAISFLKALGYNAQQRECAVALWTRESRFDHLADNPRSTAFGIAQLLRERSGEPELQILHAIRYVEHRYRGSFCSSLRHSNRVGWY